ncbi:hypothetical protein BRARA_B02925 [Brassica rapa]|uniref:Complex 1 LYR protein domain-containing protein n=1 Tax=Brassica campestris TaxID=3711 RepID=A0A398AK04_BRACM|nr:hypothetical protein BRARA_B02925 [Brassica rapa]RID75911.1 hypothetical protein BRARA_B02925 [Brassica rapa]
MIFTTPLTLSHSISKLSRLCTKNRICFLYAKSSLLRAGRQYPDYNIREYTKRKTLDGFRMNKKLTGGGGFC